MNSQGLNLAPRDIRRQAQYRDVAIKTLIKETHADAERIRRLYDAALARLALQARMKTHVTVMAAQLVRTAILKEAEHQPE